jgi:hypothetical protein
VITAYDTHISFCDPLTDMEPVVSSPILISQIPTQRFSEEHLDEYRDEAVEIFVEHPLPSRMALDLLEDSLSPYHGGSLRSFTPPPLSCWDHFWSCVSQFCCC